LSGHLERSEIRIAGKRLEVLQIAAHESGRATIVVLHEGLGSIALWKDFPEQLAARTGCGVLVYSRYGHGNSDKLMEKRPVSFMHQEGEVVLPELLDKLGILRPILAGHSDGGSIALIFAGKYPDRPRALILEAPHVFVEELSIASIAKAKLNYQTTDLRQKLSRYHAHVDATFWGWNEIWLDPEFRAWNIESYLPQIRCPILCIQGEDDEYGTVAQVEAIKAKAPQTEIIMLPNGKHSPHRDQPERTLQKMAEFVERIDGAECASQNRSRKFCDSASLRSE
jgi:pimeloyl-ACP methyl ester carboxylesterase